MVAAAIIFKKFIITFTLFTNNAHAESRTNTKQAKLFPSVFMQMYMELRFTRVILTAVVENFAKV